MTYAGAVPITAVVCPAWCEIPQQEHLDDLENWDGHCIHWHRRQGNGWHVDLASSTYVDGTPDGEPVSIHTHAEAEALSIDGAEEYARALLAAVAMVRVAQAPVDLGKHLGL